MDRLISVIVPVYNVERYLTKCVDSIIRQTYRNIEIILIDDGSTDGSADICDRYADTHANIKVIHKPNGGLSSARNAGLSVASGEYIGFVDSDDCISHDMYKTLSAYLAENHTAFVSCGIELVKGEGVEDISYINYHDTKEPEKWPAAKYYEWFVDSIGILPLHNVWNKLFRASVISGIRFLEGRNNEDCQFMYQLAEPIIAGGYNFALIPDKLYKYQLRKGSICHDHHTPLFIDEIKNLNSFILDETFDGHPAYEKLKDKYTWKLSNSMDIILKDDSLYKKYFRAISPYFRSWPIKQFARQYHGVVKMKVGAAILTIKTVPSIYRLLRRQ